MIYSQQLHELSPRSVQWRMHINPSWHTRTMGVRVLQVPAPADNPGGFLAYPVDVQVCDLPFPRVTTLTDVIGLFNEATMQLRLPGID